jgi:hypothetical protein
MGSRLKMSFMASLNRLPKGADSGLSFFARSSRLVGVLRLGTDTLSRADIVPGNDGIVCCGRRGDGPGEEME